MPDAAPVIRIRRPAREKLSFIGDPSVGTGRARSARSCLVGLGEGVGLARDARVG